MQSPWGYGRMTVQCPYDFTGPAKVSCGDLACSLRPSQESTIIFGPRLQYKTLRCHQDHRAVPIRVWYDVTAMCLRTTSLRFFQICHCAESNKIVEATMPVNPFDNRKVSLWRLHRNGDLDIVRASYTCRKANVTEALLLQNLLGKKIKWSASFTFYLFIPTRLMNSIKHEHSCSIFYLHRTYTSQLVLIAYNI